MTHDCTWDEKTGRPVTKLDRELDDVLQTKDNLEYVDISLITKEVIRPSDAIASSTFILELDTGTRSNFGRVKDKTLKAIGLSRIPPSDADEKSTISGITLDIRMSKMEEELSSMSDMLKILVCRTNTGNRETHTNISQQEAEDTSIPPEIGV